MKIVFFGTPGFAADNLDALLDCGFDVVTVVTPPDSKSGRGKVLKACDVKKRAINRNIPVLQPYKLRDSNFINELCRIKADLFIVVAFRMLPEIVWKIPPKRTINLHTSLLPNYKGAAPINWVLINGEKNTGVTTFYIDQDIDSGEILLQEDVLLNNDLTAADLHDILLEKGKSVLVNTVKMINNNSIKCSKQNNTSVHNLAPKINKEILKINWTLKAEKIHNLVRGLSPYTKNVIVKNVAIFPSAWTYLDNGNGENKRIKIHLTETIHNNTTSPNLISDNKSYLHVPTGEGLISILRLQIEGKNPITISQFLLANKITKFHKFL